MIAETHEAWKTLVTGRADWRGEEEGGGEGGASSGGAGGGASSGGATAPSIVSAGLTRSHGSAGALAAMVGAPENVTSLLLGGKGLHEHEEGEIGAGALTL